MKRSRRITLAVIAIAAAVLVQQAGVTALRARDAGRARPTAAVAAADTVPVVAIARPTVVALYTVPPGDSLLEADQGLASLLDDFMYYWADSRPRLEALDVAPVDQPLAWGERRVRVRIGARAWTFALRADSADVRGAVGYLLAAPGREPRLLHGLLVDEDLADSARAYFRRPAR